MPFSSTRACRAPTVGPQLRGSAWPHPRPPLRTWPRQAPGIVKDLQNNFPSPALSGSGCGVVSKDLSILETSQPSRAPPLVPQANSQSPRGRHTAGRGQGPVPAGPSFRLRAADPRTVPLCPTGRWRLRVDRRRAADQRGLVGLQCRIVAAALAAATPGAGTPANSRPPIEYGATIFLAGSGECRRPVPWTSNATRWAGDPAPGECLLRIVALARWRSCPGRRSREQSASGTAQEVGGSNSLKSAMPRSRFWGARAQTVRGGHLVAPARHLRRAPDFDSNFTARTGKGSRDKRTRHHACRVCLRR